MSKLKKFIVDKNGQWAHPGKPTMIPDANGRITMPGLEYQFPGNHVYEIPMAKMGGDPSIPNLSNKGWLSKYQDGGIIKIGTKLEARQAGNTYEVRRPNANSWITLNDDQLATFKEMFGDDLPDNGPVWSVEKVMRAKPEPKPKKVTPQQAASQKGPINPAIADVAPTVYSAISGVDLPKAKDVKEDLQANEYKNSPYFHVTPYDTVGTAVKEYEKTPDYSLRHKADNQYTPDEIKGIQNHLLNTGYISAQKKLDPANYKTKDEVLSLQKYLIGEGMADKFLNKNVRNLSGTMDKQTLAAIDQYNKNRLPFKEGELDDTTKMAINKYKEDADATNTLDVKIVDPESPDVSSETILKSFQDNLAARGYFTGDYDFRLEPKPLGEAKVAYNFKVSDNPDTPFEYCAQYLSGNVGKEDVAGMQEREKLGIYGDAWGMPDNIIKKGGKLLFKGLPERRLTDYKSKQDIESGVKSALLDPDLMSDLRSMVGSGNVKDRDNLPQIRPGDVVNMFYEGSPSAEIAYNQTGPNNNSFYTTHIGIVKADDDGNLYVEHNVHKKIQKDPIQKFLNGEVKGNGGKGVTLISGITRPNYFTDVDWNGTISPSGVSYYQTEAGKVNPKGALANPGDWGMQTIGGEQTHKFMSTIENNKDILLKDIPISEREYNQLMRAARVLPTTETTGGKNLKGWSWRGEDIGKELVDATGLAERSRGFTNIKDEQNFNPELREKLIKDDSDLNDPVKAAIPTFYALSNRYLYLKEFANRNNIKVTPEELSKLSLMAYTHRIESVASDLRAAGSFNGYVQKQEEAAKKRGNETFQGKNMLDIFDKQTMKKGGPVQWLHKYQGDKGSSQVTSNLNLPSFSSEAQQSADYAKGWDEYNKGVQRWTDLLAEKENKKGRPLTTEEKQQWLLKTVRKSEGRDAKNQVDPSDPKWNFLFNDSYQSWDPEIGPMMVYNKPVEVSHQLTDLEKEKQSIARKWRRGEMTPFAKSVGMTEMDPRVQKRASQAANDEIALSILNRKPQGDMTRPQWLNTLTPEERSTIERSEYSGKLDPDLGSQYFQGIEKNVRNAANIALVGPSNWAQGNNAINHALWTNSNYTPEEAANASALGVLAPFAYPSNLVTGAITGDMSAAIKGQRSKPLFVDPRQPGFAAAMSGVYEAGYDPLNAMGLGLLEGIPGSQKVTNAINTGKNFINSKFAAANSTRDLEELRRAYHNAERFLTLDEAEYLRKHGHGLRENYLAPENILPPPPPETHNIFGTDYVSGSYSPDYIDLRRPITLNPVDTERRFSNLADFEDAGSQWFTDNNLNIDNLDPGFFRNAWRNIGSDYGIDTASGSTLADQISQLSADKRKAFLGEMYQSLPTIFSQDDIRRLRQSASRSISGSSNPRNQSGLTKEQLLARVDPKNKDKVSKLTEDEFKKTVLKPNGEVVEYKPGTEIDKMTYDTSGRRMVLKDQMPLSEEEYAQAFNENLDLLNQMIAERNRTGIQYRVKGLDKNGRLRFETPAGQTYTNDAGELISIPEGETSWAVNINPGQWRGNVEDIANTEYFRSIPGLEMSNTTQGVFADQLPRRGSGTYDALNDYLKSLDLGRIKPGFNSQTPYSKGAWENFIKSGKAFGFYGGPNVVYGTMRTMAPYAVPTMIGAAAAASQKKFGGWLTKYQGDQGPSQVIDPLEIQRLLHKTREALGNEYERIAALQNNAIANMMSHHESFDNKPFCTVLPNGQQYCATRATETLRTSGYPVKQIPSGRRLKQELTPEKGWYPTTYDQLQPGDVTQIQRPGYWHTMVSSGDVKNVDPFLTKGMDPAQKGFFYDSGSGHDWTFESPRSEGELADWMNPEQQGMLYYTYKGNIPALESQYADYLKQANENPVPKMKSRPVTGLKKGGSTTKNQYINNVSLKPGSWLNKYQ